jgi:hypothetical protein
MNHAQKDFPKELFPIFTGCHSCNWGVLLLDLSVDAPLDGVEADYMGVLLYTEDGTMTLCGPCAEVIRFLTVRGDRVHLEFINHARRLRGMTPAQSEAYLQGVDRDVEERRRLSRYPFSLDERFAADAGRVVNDGTRKIVAIYDTLIDRYVGRQAATGPNPHAGVGSWP